MSSFVIGKREYIKAAGFVSGIAEKSSMREFWIYDYTVGRNMTKEDYHRQFTAFYNMNALSVQAQYGDATCEEDSNDYMEDFNKYRNIGKSLVGAELTRAVLDLSDFFRSACYQTEDEECNKYMRAFFDRVIVEIYTKTHTHECKCWGNFNIERESEVVPLF